MPESGGKPFCANEISVKRWRGHVSNDGPTRSHERATRGPHTDRTAVPQHDLINPLTGAEVGARGSRPRDQCIGQPLRPASGHGEPDVLAEHGEQPTEDATAGGVGRHIAVHGIAGQQQSSSVALELFGGEATHGKSGQARQIYPAGHSDPAKQRDQ